MAERFKRYNRWFRCSGKDCPVEADLGWIKYVSIKIEGKTVKEAIILCDKCYHNRRKKNVVKGD